MRQVLKMVTPNLSESQKNQIDELRRPAEKTVIIAILAKLAIHKRMENDHKRQIILFTDYADLLFGEPEYALIQAILHLIEYDLDPYFPTLAVIRKVIDSFKLDFSDYESVLLEDKNKNEADVNDVRKVSEY